eukprot:gene23670-biopygen10376
MADLACPQDNFLNRVQVLVAAGPATTMRSSADSYGHVCICNYSPMFKARSISPPEVSSAGVNVVFRRRAIPAWHMSHSMDGSLLPRSFHRECWELNHYHSSPQPPLRDHPAEFLPMDPGDPGVTMVPEVPQVVYLVCLVWPGLVCSALLRSGPVTLSTVPFIAMLVTTRPDPTRPDHKTSADKTRAVLSCHHGCPRTLFVAPAPPPLVHTQIRCMWRVLWTKHSKPCLTFRRPSIHFWPRLDEENAQKNIFPRTNGRWIRIYCANCERAQCAWAHCQRVGADRGCTRLTPDISCTPLPRAGINGSTF